MGRQSIVKCAWRPIFSDPGDSLRPAKGSFLVRLKEGHILPDGQTIKPLGGFPRRACLHCVQINAIGASVDLADPHLDQRTQPLGIEGMLSLAFIMF